MRTDKLTVSDGALSLVEATSTTKSSNYATNIIGDLPVGRSYQSIVPRPGRIRAGMGSSAPLRAQPMAILPVRDSDPPSPTPFAPSETGSPADVLRWAETLGVPWKRILLGEIEAEQRLRRYLADLDTDCALPSALTILSFSFLQSWRVRDQIESLACQARGASDRGAVRQLRVVFQRLTGKGDRDQVAFAQHLWFAYQRVLLLQRVCRTAARSHGTMAERLASICSRARCSYDDAAWAVCEEDSVRRGQQLEAAVRKAREEGFLIPRADTEVGSLMVLRRIVRVSAHPARRRPSARRSGVPVSAPRRVQLPVDAL
jgi:hypothetical protein